MLTKEQTFEKIEKSLHLPDISDKTRVIFSLLTTPGTVDIDALAELIQENTELSNFILGHLNSEPYRRRGITDIKEAVVFLGLESIQNFLIYFVAQKFFKLTEKRTCVFDMRVYWKHVLATSIAADMLAAQLHIPDRIKFFSYGLNHDIGLLVMNNCLTEELDEIATKIQSGVPQIVAEKSVLGGATHDQIGAWLCKRWNFPPQLIRVVEYHHTPYLIDQDRQLLEIMFLADLIGSYYYQKLLDIHRHMPVSNRVLNSLGLTVDDQRKIGELLPDKVEQLASRFIL